MSTLKNLAIGGMTAGGVLAVSYFAIKANASGPRNNGKSEFNDRFLGGECSVVIANNQKGNGRTPTQLAKKEIVAERIGDMPPHILNKISKNTDAFTLEKKQ